MVFQMHNNLFSMDVTHMVMHLVVGLWAEQMNVCCQKVISNVQQENTIVLLILKLVDHSSNTNHIVCLGDILDWNIDLNIVKEVSPVWSKTQRCTSIPH